ncbi:methyltransferase [Yersinia similis]|uniref:Methyltransferase n=1 Tax=Yersinia similis TaxID=367190 RepID=A0ABM5Q2L8_9GAMM|nr:methyltransferase [Yersinia similis]
MLAKGALAGALFGSAQPAQHSTAQHSTAQQQIAQKTDPLKDILFKK